MCIKSHELLFAHEESSKAYMKISKTITVEE